jgi:5'-3' exonuclease
MVKTLIIDGNYLLKRGTKGAKNVIFNGDKIGGLYQFIITIKMMINKIFPDRVVVFWDGEYSKDIRRTFYPEYKIQREEINNKIDKDYQFNIQKVKSQYYCEELYLRQFEDEGSEADDCMAYYCLNTPNEYKYVYTNDRDILQLISSNTEVFLADKRDFVNEKNWSKYLDYTHKNVSLVKVLTGCNSDNIAGVYGMGEPTLFKLFPELIKEEKTLEWVIEKGKQLLPESRGREASVLRNLINGKSKHGVMGETLYITNKKIIDLSQPLVTDKVKERINDELINGVLNPEGRDYKVLMKQMINDGIYSYMPKSDSGFIDFFRPFYIIMEKEKKLYKKAIL